jgi:hypothetical protein
MFDRVTALLPGTEGRTPQGEEGDSYIVEFSYHWPEPPAADGTTRPAVELTARVFLRRAPNGWAVDDERSKALVPTWPRLPAVPNPFSSGVRVP